MAAGGPETSSGAAQREAHLLVTLVDVSDAFVQSLQLEDPAQQVENAPSAFTHARTTPHLPPRGSYPRLSVWIA